jgi:hypothetical protein
VRTGGDGRRQFRFVVSRQGTCSFCGKRDGEASAFAEVAARPHHICGACLGLCLDVTCEYDKREERSAVAAQLASFEPGRELHEKLEPAFRSGDINGIVEALREQGHSDVDPDQIRALLASFSTDRPCSVGARHSAAQDACSFCNAARDEVATLLTGQRATICDRCIDAASADVADALLTN